MSMIPKIKILGSRQGFTMIETLISILILLVMMTAGTAFYYNSSRIMAMTMRKKKALEMATQAIENAKDTGYSGLTALGIWQDIPLSGWDTTDIFPQSPAPQRQRRVTNDTVAGAVFKKVEVSVVWQEPGSSSSGSIFLATYLAP
jgi:prepilin-type N-terminal cleavage/methylation domain-containing protein